MRGNAKMPQRVDDAGGLFRSFWTTLDVFREFNRDADAGDAENRWPLIRSMPLGKRVTLPPLSIQQKQGWIDRPALQSEPRAPVFSRLTQPEHSDVSEIDTLGSFARTGATGDHPRTEGTGSGGALINVFKRLEGAACARTNGDCLKSIFDRLPARSGHVVT